MTADPSRMPAAATAGSRPLHTLLQLLLHPWPCAKTALLYLTDLCRAVLQPRRADPAPAGAAAGSGAAAAAPAAAAPAAAPAAAAPPPSVRVVAVGAARRRRGRRLAPGAADAALPHPPRPRPPPAPRGRGGIPSSTRSAGRRRMLGPPPRRRRRRAVGVVVSIATEAEFARLCSGAPQGRCTSVLTAHPRPRGSQLARESRRPPRPRRLFLFDDRSHVAHLGPSEAAEAGRTPSSRRAARRQRSVGLVRRRRRGWDDAPLVTPLLQLLGLLGVGVAPAGGGPRDSGGDGGGDHRASAPRGWRAAAPAIGRGRRAAAVAHAACRRRRRRGRGRRDDGGRRRRPTAAARARRTARRPTARGELDGGAWAALRLLVHIVADASLAQVAWEALRAPRGLPARPRRPNPPPPRAARRRLGVTVGGGGGARASAAASTAARRHRAPGGGVRRGRAGAPGGGRPHSSRPRRRARCRGRGSAPSAG